MLGSLVLYLKGIRIMMFQLSGFYYNPKEPTLFIGAYIRKIIIGIGNLKKEGFIPNNLLL